MARGRKPDPAAVRKAKGNPGKRPIGGDPAPAATGDSDVGANTIAAPSWLEGDAREIWNTHAPIQQRLKLLSEADINAFGRYCQMFQMWIDCNLDIKKNGTTYQVKSNHGEWLRPNPSFMMMKSLNQELIKIEDRFGMSPAERQRIFASRAGSGSRAPGELPFPGESNRKPSRQNHDSESETKPEASPGPVGLLN